MHRYIKCAALIQSCGGVCANVFCAPVNRLMLDSVRHGVQCRSRTHSSLPEFAKILFAPGPPL